MIPLVKLKTVNTELQNKIKEVLSKGIFMGGDELSIFEKNFGKYLDINYVIPCANGTDAIEIALRALNIQTGDEVLVPAMSWVSTSQAVINIGAIPIFVDIESDTPNIDPVLIKDKISQKTKAILVVHLYGFVADMTKIMEIANKYDLKVIEDCAQSHGAKYGNRKTGTIGDIGTFSFYPTKNLGAYGDAGAIVTDNEQLANECRIIANLGQDGRHNHVRDGINSRMDTLQAGILNVKLGYLDQWNARRRAIAGYYQDRLSDKYQLYKEKEPGSSVYHLFNIRTKDRDKLRQHLADKHIITEIHYPKPLPFLTQNRRFVTIEEETFTHATTLAKKGLSIPLYPELTSKEIDIIVHALRQFR